MSHKIRNYFLHRVNPLHIYCRLREYLPKKLARWLCIIYEKVLFKPLLLLFQIEHDMCAEIEKGEKGWFIKQL